MKDTRVNIRIPTAEKEAWEAAAARYGMSLTEFVTRSVRMTMLDLHQSETQSAASGVGLNLVRWPSRTQEAL